MSDKYELDDTCDVCSGQMEFKLTEIEGHQRKHRVGTCKKCGFSAVVSMCKCKTSVTNGLSRGDNA